METDAERLWARCADALRPMVTEAAWRMWFAHVQPSWADEHRLVLVVPSALAKERLTSGHLDVIRDVLAEVVGKPVAVELVVRAPSPGDGSTGRPRDPVDAAAADGTDLTADVLDDDLEVGLPVGDAPTHRERGGLNPMFSFDAFVTADSNRFARAAAGVVAETPGLAYNPLVIYGGSGLGKTHLLHAIGNYVNQHFPHYRVQYAVTESCMNEFVEALRTRTTLDFKRRYRECDVLLLDDFQFIMTSERLGEEFFYTFNELEEASKQIVIVSDRSPTEMMGLHERFRSRLLSGLVTDVHPPDLETRLAILRKKAERQVLEVPDEILELVATQVRDNIRELEGALNRVVAFARHNEEPLTTEMAERVLDGVVSRTRPRPITPALVLEEAAAQFGFTVEELTGQSRRRPLVLARQVAMYVLRELTEHSYPTIAREFGGRDHTTVIHAVNKIEGLMQEREAVFHDVEQLTKRLQQRG